MKAKDAERGVLLAKAYNGIKRLEKALERTKPDPNAGDWRGMVIGIGDWCDDGGGNDAEIKIDLALAAKLIPHLRDLIGDELAALGIEP